MSGFDDFKKTKEYVVCIDSDGCAMDTMNIKHIKCFGPCMVKEWGLEQWQDEILNSWNQVNLYTVTRGINRFKGLATALDEVNKTYTPIDGVELLVDWAENAPELSNPAVEEKSKEHEIFKKALSWSVAVNEAIENLPREEVRPFDGVKEALEEIHKYCDVAVVSSANPKAVRDEWERFGLLEHVDLLCTQDMGSKAYCISEIKKKGYESSKVLMCGDAVGDMKAAAENGVLYYPINVNHENESWTRMREEALERFLNGTFEGGFQDIVMREFLENLK